MSNKRKPSKKIKTNAGTSIGVNTTPKIQTVLTDGMKVVRPAPATFIVAKGQNDSYSGDETSITRRKKATFYDNPSKTLGETARIANQSSKTGHRRQQHQQPRVQRKMPKQKKEEDTNEYGASVSFLEKYNRYLDNEVYDYKNTAESKEQHRKKLLSELSLLGNATLEDLYADLSEDLSEEEKIVSDLASVSVVEIPERTIQRLKRMRKQNHDLPIPKINAGYALINAADKKTTSSFVRNKDHVDHTRENRAPVSPSCDKVGIFVGEAHPNLKTVKFNRLTFFDLHVNPYDFYYKWKSFYEKFYDNDREPINCHKLYQHPCLCLKGSVFSDSEYMRSIVGKTYLKSNMEAFKRFLSSERYMNLRRYFDSLSKTEYGASYPLSFEASEAIVLPRDAGSHAKIISDISLELKYDIKKTYEPVTADENGEKKVETISIRCSALEKIFLLHEETVVIYVFTCYCNANQSTRVHAVYYVLLNHL